MRVTYAGQAGSVSPVDGLPLRIGAREVVGLIGDAGSGKFTAALALLGLVRPPGRITAGEVLFQGRDLLTMSDLAGPRDPGRRHRHHRAEPARGAEPDAEDRTSDRHRLARP